MIPSWFPTSLPSDIWLRHAQIRRHCCNRHRRRLTPKAWCGSISASPTATSPPSPRPVRLRRGSIWTEARSGPASSMGMCISTRRKPGLGNRTRTARIPAPRPPSSPTAPILHRRRHRTSIRLWSALRIGTRHRRHSHPSRQLLANAKAHWAVFRRMRDAWSGRIDLQAASICPWTASPATMVPPWRMKSRVQVASLA